MGRKVDQNFVPLFQKGERREIYGKDNINFKVLILILTFTFCAIGGANLALRDLELKMSDPFVNLLSVDIPFSKRNVAEDLKSELDNDTLKRYFDYLNVTNYVEFPIQFSGNETAKWVKGRSIDLNNPILKKLIEPDNVIVGTGFEEENEIGLIISQRLLDDLKYSKTPTHIIMRFNNQDVPIPIRAIVKELPELNYFIASPFFFFQRTQLGGTAFDISRNVRLVLFLKGRENAAEFKKQLELFFEKSEKYKNWDVEVLQRVNTETYVEGIECTLEFFGYRANKSEDYEELVADLSNSLRDFDFTRYYDFEFNNFPSFFKIESDKIAVNFSSLNKVREFQTLLFDKYQLEVDTAKVRDKENFLFIKLLTELISFLLIIFSVVSICIYLYNLLNNHLNKIKPNLGTFVAFGLDPKTVYRLYRTLLMQFLLYSLGVGLIASMVLLILISSLTGSLANFLAIFDWKLLSILLVLISSFYIIFKITIEKILRKTPGDLIYNR